MNTMRKRLVAGALALGAIVAPAASASASDTVVPIGDPYHDRAGQHAYFGAAHCGVLAGDPVVVTINGNRYLQATGTVACEGASIESASTRFEQLSPSRLLSGSTRVTVSSSVALAPGQTEATSSSRMTILLRKRCGDFRTNSYASQLTVLVRDQQTGRLAEVYDASRFNGRSCGF